MRALKCTVLFFNAVMLLSIGREMLRAWAMAHAGMPNTLYHFLVLYDTNVPAPNEGSIALAMLAPFALSAALGAGAAFGYRHVQSAAARLFLLYLGTFAAIGVFSDLTFVAWSGSLYELGAWLELPAFLLVGISLMSGIVFVVILWEAGRRAQPAASALVIPVVAGTTLRALALAPIPAVTLINLAGGSALWLIAIAGALWQQRPRRRNVVSPASAPQPLAPVNLAWSAMTLPIMLFLIVRLMSMGVRFEG